MGFFFLCLFPHQRIDGISLEGLCRYLMEQGTCISKQSLQERFTPKAAGFIKSIVAHALKVRLKISSNNFQTVFKRILVGDSTVFELPENFHNKYRGTGGGASAAAIKIQYSFDLLSGNILMLENKQGISSDQNSKLPDLKVNDLLIEDLGYFSVGRFKEVMLSGAKFLSRLKFDINIFLNKNDTYQAFDLLKEEKEMQSGEIREYQVCIGKNEKLPVRIIIEKVDPHVAAEKRRKLKADKQNKRKNISERRLKLCNLSVYITNASQEEIPNIMARKYYSLRWQVEIIFKAWKSVFRIDQVKSMKLERFECIHYGLLTLIILTNQIFIVIKKSIQKYNIEISELKFFICIKEFLTQLNSALNCKQELPEYLDCLWKKIKQACKKDQKRTKLSPFTILKLIA